MEYSPISLPNWRRCSHVRWSGHHPIISERSCLEITPFSTSRYLQHLRAQTLLFWPGMNKDIQQVRDECFDCCRNAPSQPAPLAVANPDIPVMPFESVFADFFDISNHHYLVAGDRLSGWVEVFSCKSRSIKAGSSGLLSLATAVCHIWCPTDTIHWWRAWVHVFWNTGFSSALGNSPSNILCLFSPVKW